LERAAAIAIGQARRFAASARTVKRILFCLFEDRALAAFETALSR
jgi:O-acetyl-ADP-ribose deacetylase (regulator of RNase III)